MFFWGGHAAGAQASFGRRLILMGVWRDPSLGRSHKPKKRARFEHCRCKARNETLAVHAAKKIFAPLDEGPANGCRRNWRN